MGRGSEWVSEWRERASEESCPSGRTVTVWGGWREWSEGVVSVVSEGTEGGKAGMWVYLCPLLGCAPATKVAAVGRGSLMF